LESSWRDMSEDDLAKQLEEILDLHPHHPRAKAWLEQLGTAAERQQKKLSNFKTGQFITNRLGMRFAWVPSGESWLGGGGGTLGMTPFTLKEALWCGVYPVTQAEWKAVMGNNPSHFQGNLRYPVEQ